jgi:hypothetical protein
MGGVFYEYELRSNDPHPFPHGPCTALVQSGHARGSLACSVLVLPIPRTEKFREAKFLWAVLASTMAPDLLKATGLDGEGQENLC